VAKVHADYHTAPVRDEVKAALGFIEKLVKGTPTVEDVRAVYARGVTRDMLVRAVHVAVAFSMIVRLADAFAFEVGTPEDFDAAARSLMKRGYGL
jgi:alkylhydroperoxidase family enzyme